MNYGTRAQQYWNKAKDQTAFHCHGLESISSNGVSTINSHVALDLLKYTFCFETAFHVRKINVPCVIDGCCLHISFNCFFILNLGILPINYYSIFIKPPQFLKLSSRYLY